MITRVIFIIIIRYDNPAEVDKLSGIRANVEETTAIMADSVKVMLDSTEKADKLTDDVGK